MNDEALASAIALLSGEWAEQTGGVLETRVIAGDELLSGDGPEADVVVFPSRWLGELCEEDRLRPMRQSVLESPDVQLGDFFPPVRDRVIAHGGRVMALPLGCPVPVLAAPSGEGMPDAWADVPEESLAIVAPDDVEPYKNAYLLLARAAAAMDDGARDTMLFDPETMAPRLTTPPLVRALEAMRAARAAEESQASLRVVWPLRAEQPHGDWADDSAIAPLPGAGEVYDPLSGQWRTLDGPPQRVALLGASGRLVGVPATSRNTASAFRLAGWLAGAQNARGLAVASPGVARVRRSQARVPDDWLGGGAARAFAAAQADSLGWERCFVVPGVVRVDEYLAALEGAIQEALAGRVSAAEALERASAEWVEITESVGVQRQRDAYLRRLGIESYRPPRG